MAVLRASLLWEAVLAGPVAFLTKLQEEPPAAEGLWKGHRPIPRRRSRDGHWPQAAEAETVFLDLQLCFNVSVELTALELFVEDVEPLRAGRFNLRVLHPIPSSSQSATQWFRLGEAWPLTLGPETPGAFRAELRPSVRLGYADCLGWSLQGGGKDPLAFDESTPAEVAWARSSEGLHDAAELHVKRAGLDPLTSAARKDPHIDWTGLERRTYSVRILYKEVAQPAPAAPVEPLQRAPVVEGGNPACWRAGFTFEQCCKEEVEGCWDSAFTFERCCSLTSVKRFADLDFRPSTSHYDLTHLRRDNEPRLGPVQDDEALLLYGLVRALRPRTIVEFGTSHGFSALNWLHAIADDPQALVHSYDILPYPSAQALEDSDPRFIFHGKSQADFEASDVAPRLVDVAFFDAGHLVEYSLKAFERLLPALAPNAIIAVHDTGLHVRDFGSGAPQEEEGLPFNLQRCAARAGGQQRCFRFPGCEGESDLQGFCVGRAHRPSERQFVAEVLARWPSFRPLHLHSRRVFRHGLTLLQRGGLLGVQASEDGVF